jgi:hypothetical protein
MNTKTQNDEHLIEFGLPGYECPSWPETAYDDGHLLICPLCNPGDGINNHVRSVATEFAPDADEAQIYRGTVLCCVRQSSERRSALRIDFDGECGHRWTLIFQQHKGRIYVSYRGTDEVWLSSNAAAERLEKRGIAQREW